VRGPNQRAGRSYCNGDEENAAGRTELAAARAPGSRGRAARRDWAIHLDLYLTGYRSIPVIGWLFLLQVIAAFGLAAVVLVSGSRLAAAVGAGFVLSTLGGYLATFWRGRPRYGSATTPVPRITHVPMTQPMVATC
jgi:hypothetical protein